MPRVPPKNWGAWWTARPKWAYPILIIQWGAEWLAYWLEGWAIIQVLASLSHLSVLLAVVFFFTGLPEKIKEKHIQAWQVLNAAEWKQSSAGRQEVLQDLVRDGVSLQRINLAQAFLPSIDLTGRCGRVLGGCYPPAILIEADLERADLTQASLTKVFLSRANLNGAILREAHLEQAAMNEALLNGAFMVDAHLAKAEMAGGFLTGAQLTRADLAGANLRNAYLTGAELTGAKLEGAQVAGAIFTGAVGLTSQQLDSACVSVPAEGVRGTLVPEYLASYNLNRINPPGCHP